MDYPAEGFEASHIREIGDRLTLSGTDRRLTAMTLTLSSWAHSEDFGNAANFSYPLTLRIYQGGTVSFPGPLLASVTKNFIIPYRPVGWPSNGIAFNVTFDLSPANIVVPDTLVYTISANTSHFGASPTGAPGNQNYNYLAFAYDNTGRWCGTGSIGANDPVDIFDIRDAPNFYWDGSMPSNSLRRDLVPQLGGQSLTPIVQVSADSYYWETSSVFITGPSEFYFSGGPQGPTNATVFGSTNAPTFVYSSSDGIGYPQNPIPPSNSGSYWAIANAAPSAGFAGAVSMPFPFAIRPFSFGSTNTVGTDPSTTNRGVTQNSATFSVQIIGPSNFPYNGTAQGPTNAIRSGGTQSLNFLYSSIDGITYPTNSAMPTNVGVYSVTAVLMTNMPFLTPISAPFIYTISPTPLSIVALNASKVVGASLDLSGPQSGFVAVGLTNSETIGWISLVASGGTATSDPIGTYLLNPFAASGGSFSSNNYSVSYLPGQLSVVPAQWVISVTGTTDFSYSGKGQGPTNVSVIGSSAPPTLIYSSSDGVTYPPRNTPPTNAGTYSLTVSVPSDAYHQATVSPPVAFRITPIPLTIQAQNISKPYGTTLVLGPGQTGFTATGTVNNETVGTVTLSCPGGTAVNAPVGSYAVIPSAAVGGTFKSQNYTLSYLPATLTVTPVSSLAGDVPVWTPWSLATGIGLFVAFGSRFMAARGYRRAND